MLRYALVAVVFFALGLAVGNGLKLALVAAAGLLLLGGWMQVRSWRQARRAGRRLP